MDLAVSTKDLSKTFGKQKVLNNINLQVPTGSCYGLSLIHISEPTRREWLSRMPSSA